MSKAGKAPIAMLLLALLLLHMFHLYNAWTRSKIEIVEAVYEVPQIFTVGFAVGTPHTLPNPREILSERLKLDGQAKAGYAASIWHSTGKVHVSFALVRPDPEQTLRRFGADFYQKYWASLPPPVLAAARCAGVSQPSNDSAATLPLLSWHTRFNPSVKPLDILSLAILVGVLLLLLKGNNEKPEGGSREGREARRSRS